MRLWNNVPTVRIVELALALFVSGCSGLNSGRPLTPPLSPPPSTTAVPCNPGDCTITVTVTGTCALATDITVDKPLVAAKNAVNMRWIITPTSYSFASNGIQIYPDDRQFEPKPSAHPYEFRLLNNHRSSGDSYYYINIQGCAQADPFIRNE